MEQVLFVDDDRSLLDGMRRTLYKSYKVDCAEGPAEAFKRLSEGTKYSVIVSDMRMPEMDGVEFFSKVSNKYPDPIRIMLTGNNDLQTAINAVNLGHIFCFLNKPCDKNELVTAIDSAIQQFRLKDLERDLLERTLAGSVKVLLDVMRYTNPLAFGRTCAIRKLALDLAQNLGERNLWEVKIATMLSTIGWLSVPEFIIEKVIARKELDPSEHELVRQHTEVAYNLLSVVPRLEQVANIVRFQDLNFDGSGSDVGSAFFGEDIPLCSRVLKVLNSVTPLNSTRPPTIEAVDKLPMDGREYDPVVIVALKDILSHQVGTDVDELRTYLEVPPKSVRAGDMLEENLHGADGSLLLTAGNEISEFHIAKLRQNEKFMKLASMVHISRSIF